MRAPRCAGRAWPAFTLLLAAFGIVLLVALAPPVLAQTADKLDAAEAKVEALAAAGKLDAAIALSRKLVATARRTLKKDPKLAGFLTELALLEARRGHAGEAEKLQREAIAINSDVAGPDSPVMIGGFKALADILAKATPPKLAEAEATLARALAIAEDAFGPGSAEAAGVQRQLASVLESQGRAAEAGQLRARLADAEQARDKDDQLRAQDAAKAAATAEAQIKAAEAQSEGAKVGAAQPPSSEAPSINAPAAEAPAAPEMSAPETSTGEAGGGATSEAKPRFHRRALPQLAPPAPAPNGQETEAVPPPPEAPAAGGAAPPLPPPPPSGQPAQDYHVVEVFYGTNRKPAENAVRVSFTPDEADGLTLGSARITIPVNHQVPEVERPWSLRIPFTQIELSAGTEDPNRFFTIQSIKTLPEDQFLADVKERLSHSEAYKDQALVFVHGFYNTFDDALYRTAQITYDMQFDGAAFMFSWPSAGTLDAYRTDHGKAQRAGVRLRAFLDLVARKSGAKRITVIAHSMGNLPLMEALDETAPGDSPSPDTVIDDVVMAAPDVGRTEFAALAEHMNHIRGGMTLYAASNDLALAASRTVNGEGRAGDTLPDGPMLLPHVDTIDATTTSMQMFRLNHFYVAESSAVLCDLERLLRTGLHPPDARTLLLAPVKDGSGIYYAFRQ